MKVWRPQNERNEVLRWFSVVGEELVPSAALLSKLRVFEAKDLVHRGLIRVRAQRQEGIEPPTLTSTDSSVLLQGKGSSPFWQQAPLRAERGWRADSFPTSWFNNRGCWRLWLKIIPAFSSAGRWTNSCSLISRWEGDVSPSMSINLHHYLLLSVWAAPAEQIRGSGLLIWFVSVVSGCRESHVRISTTSHEQTNTRMRLCFSIFSSFKCRHWGTIKVYLILLCRQGFSKSWPSSSPHRTPSSVMLISTSSVMINPVSIELLTNVLIKNYSIVFFIYSYYIWSMSLIDKHNLLKLA